MEYHAHTPNDKGDWHDLAEHIREVTRLAEEFAAQFGAGEFARAGGMPDRDDDALRGAGADIRRRTGPLRGEHDHTDDAPRYPLPADELREVGRADVRGEVRTSWAVLRGDVRPLHMHAGDAMRGEQVALAGRRNRRQLPHDLRF